MKRIFICLAILFFIVASMGARQQQKKARTIQLTLHPAKASKPVQKYQLLPKAEEQIDADAAPLYEKAVQLLPEDFQTDQIGQWLNTPPAKLPRQQVQSTLQQFKPILQFLEQAAKCKQCDWPYMDDDTISQNLRKYRRLVFFLALQMRFQITQGRYEKAIDTAQRGFAMAKHLGEGPTLVHGLIGVSIGGFICRQLEQFVQRPDAPNLYWALQRLPRPLVDLTEQIELEMPDPDVKRRITLLMSRLDRHVTALQCIEALRLYAAAHDGKFPKELISITEVPVPNDPVMQKPFVYHRTGYNAVLEAPAPKGATERDAIRYELNLKE